MSRNEPRDRLADREPHPRAVDLQATFAPGSGDVLWGSSVTKAWYCKSSIRFACTRCGNCCKPESGYLFLTATDLRNLARALRMSDQDFFLEYCEVVDLRLAKRVSLVARDSGECVFLVDGSCRLYEHRPLQCRTFPFWASNLACPQSWEEGTSHCPGVGQGDDWSERQIEACLLDREAEPLLDVGD